MQSFMKQPLLPPNCTSIGALVTALPPSKWGVAFPVEGTPSVSPPDGVFYSRTSSPGKGKSYLGWSLKPRIIDDAAVRKLADDIKSLLSDATDA